MLPPKRYFYPGRRGRLDSLKSMMAEHRACNPGGGGHWSDHTGDGEAWHKNNDHFSKWFRVRTIRAGQWAGPWRYVKR
jgi:hypothetical protein